MFEERTLVNKIDVLSCLFDFLLTCSGDVINLYTLNNYILQIVIRDLAGAHTGEPLR